MYKPNGFSGDAQVFGEGLHQVPRASWLPRELPASRMFAIKKGLQQFAESNPDTAVYDASQGDGGQSLLGLTREELAEALVRYLPSSHATKYGTPDGDVRLREAIFSRYYRVRSNVGLSPNNVIVTDGGRDALQKWYQVVSMMTGAIGGYVITSAAPWVSYLHGPYINGTNVISAPGDPKRGFRITEEGIDACLRRASRESRRVVGLILTSPDNPTGTYYEESELCALIQHANRNGIRHIFLDLIYQMVIDSDWMDTPRYDIERLFNDLGVMARQGVTVMDGLTKSIGASNVRHAHLFAADHAVASKLRAIASHSVLPNALGEAVAMQFYGSDDPWQHPWRLRVSDATEKSRAFLREALPELGSPSLIGQGYYAFINVEPWIGRSVPSSGSQDGAEVRSSDDIALYLTEACGVAVVPGGVFCQPGWVRFSYANEPEYTKGAFNRLKEGLARLESR